MAVAIKRAYDPAEAADGYRVLVDRLWPRGRAREQLQLDEWAHDLAPITKSPIPSPATPGRLERPT